MICKYNTLPKHSQGDLGEHGVSCNESLNLLRRLGGTRDVQSTSGGVLNQWWGKHQAPPLSGQSKYRYRHVLVTRLSLMTRRNFIILTLTARFSLASCPLEKGRLQY